MIHIISSYNDMVKYIYLRDNSELVVENTEKVTQVTLKTDLPTNIFDAPVSLILDDGRIVDIYANQTIAI